MAHQGSKPGFKPTHENWDQQPGPAQFDTSGVPDASAVILRNQQVLKRRMTHPSLTMADLIARRVEKIVMGILDDDDCWCW